MLLPVMAVPAAAGADLPPGGSFVDDDGSVHEPDIEAIAATGVTNGCGPELFCPRDGVTRGQMAAFLVRLLDLPVGGFDPSGFHPDVRVILDAMKSYGLILADNGSSWFVSGAPDPRWDNDVLRQLRQLTGADFEAVDVASLQISSDSGAAHAAT